MFGEIAGVGAAEDDGAKKFDVVGRRKDGADAVKYRRHGFAGEDEAAEKNAREDQRHGHLQGLHLGFGAGGDEQADAEQAEGVEKGCQKERDEAAGNWDLEKKSHQAEKENRHGHADAPIRNEFAEHETPARQRTDEELFEG